MSKIRGSSILLCTRSYGRFASAHFGHLFSVSSLVFRQKFVLSRRLDFWSWDPSRRQPSPWLNPVERKTKIGHKLTNRTCQNTISMGRLWGAKMCKPITFFSIFSKKATIPLKEMLAFIHGPITSCSTFKDLNYYLISFHDHQEYFLKLKTLLVTFAVNDISRLISWKLPSKTLPPYSIFDPDLVWTGLYLHL